MGRPMKKRLPVTAVLMLKRARRRAPQAANRKATTTPKRPKPSSCHCQSRKAGARPKAMRSARESYWTPNSLAVWVRRATLPSMPSKRADSTMASPASSKRDCTAQTMDRKPMNMLNDVMRLGRR